MTKLKFLAAAAVVSALAAGPALAKDATDQSGKTVKTQKIKKQTRADRGYERGYDRGYANGERADFERNLNRRSTTTYYNDRSDDSVFWPAEAAAGVVAGAVTAADDIATAPFRDTYAYDNSYAAPTYRTSGWDNDWNGGWNNGWNNSWDNNWARRQSVQQGGFACTPGTWYTNSYGNTVLCQ